MKGSKKHFKRIFAVILTFALLIIAMSLPVFAASDYTYDGNNAITECNTPSISNGVVTIPSQATGIASTAFDNGVRYYDALHIFSYNAYDDITSVIIPSSVKFIQSGAFSGCKNLKSVTIQNYRSGINVASGAFSNGITPSYTQAEPTTAPPTTKPVPTTTKVTTAVAQTDSAITQQETAQKTNTASKKVTTTKKTTTTVPTTTSTTTTPVTTQIVETSAPLAATKSDDLEVWNSIVKSDSKNSDNESKNTSKNNVQSGKTTRYVADASVVVAAFSAGLLTYFKFRR